MGIDERRKQLRELMERQNLDAILLQRYQNFAWYAGVGDNRVDHSSQTGVASILVTRDDDLILADNIEAGRIGDEQVQGMEIRSFAWTEGPDQTLARIVPSLKIGTDAPAHFGTDISGEIAPLRWVLDDIAIERYKVDGKVAAAALEEAAASIYPGVTENEAAAEIAAACRRRGLFSPVVLAAGDERIARYRHPIPTDAAFRRRAMLVVCAERNGLYANITMFVHFEEPDDEWLRRKKSTETIIGRMRDEAARPGRTLGDAMKDCIRFYEEEGFPDEWKLHHQGGTTGYATREVVAAPDSPVVIQPGMAFAWNPSITGAKSEETYVLTSKGPVTVSRAGDG